MIALSRRAVLPLLVPGPLINHGINRGISRKLSSTPLLNPTVLPQPERLVAIGDIHGDAAAAEDILCLSGVISRPGGPWAMGQNVCVQMGDVLDRGVGEVALTMRLSRLAEEARAAGGSLVRLVGNHEVMNYECDFRCVHSKRQIRDPS